MKVLICLLISSAAVAQCPTPTPIPAPKPTDVCGYLQHRGVIMDKSFTSQVKLQFKCK
jgi:hypothetical protein